MFSHHRQARGDELERTNRTYLFAFELGRMDSAVLIGLYKGVEEARKDELVCQQNQEEYNQSFFLMVQIELLLILWD